MLNPVDNVFEIIKSKYPSTSKEYKLGYEIHLHIYFRRQSNLRPRLTLWYILNNKELILQPDILILGWHIKLILLLIDDILIDSLGEEEQRLFGLHAVVASSIEIGLSILEERNVDFGMTNALVATDLLELLAVVTKRHVLTHEINLRYNRQKLLHGNLPLPHNAYLYHIQCLINLILQRNAILLLIKYPPTLVELGVECRHHLILVRNVF